MHGAVPGGAGRPQAALMAPRGLARPRVADMEEPGRRVLPPGGEPGAAWPAGPLDKFLGARPAAAEDEVSEIPACMMRFLLY